MADHKTQYLAFALVSMGLIAIGLSDAHHWSNLAGGGLTVLGLGGGILTGQKLSSSVNNRDGGTINVQAEPSSEKL